MIPALAVLLAFTPVRTAETVPRGATVLHLAAGLSLLKLDLPSLPVFPLVLTGDAELAHGVADGVDVRVRYTTQLGVAHRVGPEVRARVLRGRRWALGARVFPSVHLTGAAQRGVDHGGDVSTQGALLGTYRMGFGAVTLEAGATVQWLFFSDIMGRSELDAVPYLAFVDLALEVEWPTSPTANLGVRLELSVPTAPDDPFAVLGTYPRVVFGGSFGL